MTSGTERLIDGLVGDLGDVTFVLNHLFIGEVVPACLDAADANDDDSEDIADPVFILNSLFRSGSPIPAPSPECGVDPETSLTRCPPGSASQCQ